MKSKAVVIIRGGTCQFSWPMDEDGGLLSIGQAAVLVNRSIRLNDPGANPATIEALEMR